MEHHIYVHQRYAKTPFHRIPNMELIAKKMFTRMVITVCNVSHAIQVNIQQKMILRMPHAYHVQLVEQRKNMAVLIYVRLENINQKMQLQLCANYVKLENIQTIALNVLIPRQVIILQTVLKMQQKEDVIRLHHVHVVLLLLKLANPNVKDVRLV